MNNDTALLAEYLKQAYAEVLLETAPSFDYDRAWYRVAERAKELRGREIARREPGCDGKCATDECVCPGTGVKRSY